MASISRAGRLSSPATGAAAKQPVEERLGFRRHRVEAREKRALLWRSSVHASRLDPAFQCRCGVLYQVLHLGDNDRTGRNG